MNFSTLEFLPNRQRCRQWIPLITQQYRLRHLCQIIGLNLSSSNSGSFYFTLHLTTMCAPFYTSEKISNPNPRWKELDWIEIPNTSASCVVLRVWHHNSNESDKIIVTWGVHFSGLVYIGNKIAEIQPVCFQTNTVIFSMFGGYYTSLQVIKKDVHILNNAIDTFNDMAIYKQVAMKCNPTDRQISYNIEKLKKVQLLQINIKRLSLDVQNIQEKINVFVNGSNSEVETTSQDTTSASSVRYAPQLLTMNTLNKMLQEKPTRLEKQEINKISKEIELIKFRIKLLSHEKDKKTVFIRQLKQRYFSILEDIEEKNSTLMSNYHNLSKGTEKLKKFKKDVIHHREILSQLNSQLQQRRKQIIQELLFIYPIEEVKENVYTIHGIHLPDSDKLADSPDIGLSVALGYITHILTVYSTFIQVPLRYPVTHYGSRSYITDSVSPSMTEYPLFTKGQDKGQFIYAVYLLNRNIAQLRWLLQLNTHDLKTTLPNLLTLLQSQKDSRCESSGRMGTPLNRKITFNLSSSEKYVGLHSFGSNSNTSDPISDCLRYEIHLQRLSSPTGSTGKQSSSKPCRNVRCGKGLSEILTVPEAYLNRQISLNSLRNFMVSGNCYGGLNQGQNSSGSTQADSRKNLIKITNGKEMVTICKTLDMLNIEEGTDTLDPRSNLAPLTLPVDICDNTRKHPEEVDVKQNRRLSRSAGSYSDEESASLTKSAFDLGSEPLLNTVTPSESQQFGEVPVENGQKRIIEKTRESTPFSSNENVCHSDISSNASPKENNPLTARTDALLTRKTFNLVKPKPQ